MINPSYEEISNYDHYNLDWKLRIYRNGLQNIFIRKEDFTEDLKKLILKYEEELINFVESLSKDWCQRSLHIVQKRCIDMNLHAYRNDKDFRKLKKIVYYTIFQTYLNERIRFLKVTNISG